MSKATLRSLFALIVAAVGGLACEPHAPVAESPRAPLAAPSVDTASSLTGASSAAFGEPTCACAKPGLSPATGAHTGPTVAYNGPLAGDVNGSLVETRIREAGGVPVRLTPRNRELLDSAHALVLVGGDDIDPKRYGERPHAKVRLLSPEREAFDFELIERAATLRLPVLGICLGAQELWVAARGTLIQDIPTEVGNQVDHRAKEALHAVALTPGSKVASIYGATSLAVHSNHHQAVDAAAVIPSGFVVSATSSDGLAEAFESTPENPWFVLGVGWHPERRDEERALFQEFVERARALQHRAVDEQRHGAH